LINVDKRKGTKRKLGAVRGEEVKLSQRCAKKRLFRKAVSQRNNGSET
jgi:hypothetical protein